MAQLVGVDKAAALALAAEHLPRRVPLAKPWLAGVLRAKGLPVAEIARRMRTTDVSVRGHLSRAAASEAEAVPPAQLRLF